MFRRDCIETAASPIRFACVSRSLVGPSAILLSHSEIWLAHASHTSIQYCAGSGKTSLVNALAGRLEGGALQGSILVNGRDRAKNFKNISGYVLQDDVLLGILTVC